MMRYTDIDVTVMKEEGFTHSSLEAGSMAHHTGPLEEELGLVTMQRK